MATSTQKIDCVSCGNKDTVTVVTKQTKYSRSVKVTKCSECNHQAGVLATLKND